MAILGGLRLCFHGHVHGGATLARVTANARIEEIPLACIQHGVLHMGGREIGGHLDPLCVDQPCLDPQADFDHRTVAPMPRLVSNGLQCRAVGAVQIRILCGRLVAQFHP